MNNAFPSRLVIYGADEEQSSLFHRAAYCWYILLVLILSIVLPPSAYAHRAIINDIDACRIQVGYEWIHFAAYTPKVSGNKSYCTIIPEIGMTNLVFDYEGKKLRYADIEFEVTKDPEGTRIYYRAPEKSKTGTVDGTVDFNAFGPGNYLAHVTLVQGDKKLDAHVPFSVGIEDEPVNDPAIKLLLTLLLCAGIIYISIKIATAGDSRDKERTSADQ